MTSPSRPARPAAPSRRAHIGFRWESDMLAPLRGALPTIVGREHTLAVGEVPAAVGVPDLVAVVLDEQAVERRLAAGLAPVEDLTHVAVLLALAADAKTVEDLAAAVQITAGHLRRTVLPALDAAGWVTFAAGDRAVTLLHPLEPVVIELVTVEAKKAAWQRAFKQALAHRSSADRAYIAMDAARAAAAVEHRAEMRRLGVGIVTVDAVTGRVKVVSRPRRIAPVPVHRTVLGERAWALLLAGQSTGPTWPVFGRALG